MSTDFNLHVRKATNGWVVTTFKNGGLEPQETMVVGDGEKLHEIIAAAIVSGRLTATAAPPVGQGLLYGPAYQKTFTTTGIGSVSTQAHIYPSIISAAQAYHDAQQANYLANKLAAR